MVIIAYRLFLSVILVNCYVKCMYFDLLLIGCCNEYRFCLFQSCRPPFSKCNFEVKNFAAVICMLEWQYKEGKLELSMWARQRQSGKWNNFVLSLHASCCVWNVFKKTWHMKCNIFLYIFIWLCFCLTYFMLDIMIKNMLMHCCIT